MARLFSCVDFELSFKVTKSFNSQFVHQITEPLLYCCPRPCMSHFMSQRIEFIHFFYGRLLLQLRYLILESL